MFTTNWNVESTPNYANEEFEVADVSSLYPSISMRSAFPIGQYEIITAQPKLKSIWYDKFTQVHRLGSSKLIGLAQVRIISTNTCDEPFLPIIRASDDKTIYAHCQSCVQNSNLKECMHSDMERSSILTLCWPEINFLVGVLNYRLMYIYEIYNYKQEKKIFSQFVKVLARGKLKHVIKDKSEVNIDFINKKMKFPPHLQLKASEIEENEDMASFFKKSLCSFLGKTAQVNNRNITKFVRNKSQLESLFYSENIEDLFDYGNVCHVIIKPKDRLNQNRSGNSILYSYITALARIYMHKCLLKLWSVGARVHAIENDCIYFSRPKTLKNPLIYSQAFGYFHKEYENCIITSFNSLGTKSTSISYIENGILKHKIKAKGFNLKSSIISSILEFDSLQELLCHYIEDKIVQIEVPQIHVVKNFKKMTVNQLLKRIKLTNVIITKRVYLKDCNTLPFGYTLPREGK